ncbi:hypothetical protein [Arcanobacterium phocae]|uniref:hypothetical protein n=2 Tax=Arcanobacterium phocae TaxID=131112 RepID=UPI001C0F20C0|nr:hypothetical protein [Arcanobacterium phocae]
MEVAMDAGDYDAQYNMLETRRKKATKKYARTVDEITNRQNRLAQAKAIHDYLAPPQSPLEYSDDAWNLLVNHAVVNEHGSIHIVFKAQEQYVIASKG